MGRKSTVAGKRRRLQRSELAGRLHWVAIHLLRRVRRQDPRTGLSAARLSALSVVVYAGPLTLGELAAAEQVSAPTITRIVTALEAGGLVRRRRDPRDGRAVRLQATAAGRRVLEAGRLRRVEQVVSLLSDLEDRELAPLEQAVTLLEEVLAGPQRAVRAASGASLRTLSPRSSGRRLPETSRRSST